MANTEKDKKGIPTKLTGTVTPKPSLIAAEPTKRIALVPASSADPTDDQAIWGAIRNRANAASFTNFEKFIDIIFCHAPARNPDLEATRKKLNPALARAAAPPCYHGSEAYNLLKAAAEVFLALQCGIKVVPPFKDDGTPGDEDATIPGEAGRGGTAETFEELEDALGNFLAGGSRLYLHNILNALKLNNAASPLCEGILRLIFRSLSRQIVSPACWN